MGYVPTAHFGNYGKSTLSLSQSTWYGGNTLTSSHHDLSTRTRPVNMDEPEEKDDRFIKRRSPATRRDRRPNHRPSREMSFEVSFERGAGRSLEPRIPGTVPLKKAIEATSKPAPSKQRAQPSYWDLVREIEASVCNPPPCEIGMTVDCTAWLEQNAKQSDVVTLPCGLSY